MYLSQCSVVQNVGTTEERVQLSGNYKLGFENNEKLAAYSLQYISTEDTFKIFNEQTEIRYAEESGNYTIFLRNFKIE